MNLRYLFRAGLSHLFFRATAFRNTTAASGGSSQTPIAALANLALPTKNALLGFALLFAVERPLAAATQHTAGEGTTVTLMASADGSPAPTFQWRKNGVAISGATGSVLTLNSLTTAHAASYSVLATNSAGSTVSDDVVLSIGAAGAPPPPPGAPAGDVAPTIATQPVGKTIAEGASVTFSVVASGSPAPSFQWRKNGTTIAGANSSSYTLTSATLAAAGTYTVIASNVAGSATSNGAVLTVTSTVAPDSPTAKTAPVIATQPASKTVTAGASVTFTVAASGSPAPTFQWRKNGAAIGGATGSSLVLNNVTAADVAVYTVIASNSVGSVASFNATLLVTTAPANNVAPAITTQPSSQTVNSGSGVTFTAAASGTPAPTFQWRKNGVAIAGATASNFSIAGVTSANAGTYSVVATNIVGSSTSATATLVVNVAPTISVQPTNKTVAAGKSVSFSVSASGTPAPAFQWRKNGTPISGATSSTFTRPSASTADAASYSVVVSNVAGSVTSSSATLTVSSMPVITAQPVGKTVASGGTVTLTVTASGSPAPTYRWRKNGLTIVGATSSSFTLSKAGPSHAGTYNVIVSNAAGAVVSNSATLAVTSSYGDKVQQDESSGSVAGEDTITLVDEPMPSVEQPETPTTETTPGSDANTTPVVDSTPDTVAEDPASPSADAPVASSRLVNLSILSTAGTGDNSLIVGFIVRGGANKSLLVRGIGPTLGSFGVAGTLDDTVLSLYSGSSLVSSNDDWASSDDALAIATTSSGLGAFGLAVGGRDSVLLPSLSAGSYTAQISGKSDATGVAMVEIYDAAAKSSARLANVSARTFVGTGANVATIGFVISGNAPKQLLIRAVGPTLAGFGVGGVLADPQLELFQGSTSVDRNDNWGGDEALDAAFAKVGAFGLDSGSSKDAALLVTLQPGSYSAVVSGVNNTAGVAILEVYEVQ